MINNFILNHFGVSGFIFLITNLHLKAVQHKSKGKTHPLVNKIFDTRFSHTMKWKSVMKRIIFPAHHKGKTNLRKVTFCYKSTASKCASQ